MPEWVERIQEGVLPGRKGKAVFNRNRLIPAILTGFSDSLISLTSSFHPILNYLALLGEPLPSCQPEINLETINNANEMELETAVGKGRSAGAHGPRRLLHSSPKITGTRGRDVQSGAVLQSLWKEAVPGLHLLL